MNKKDRQRLTRLKDCIDRIPTPHTGVSTHSASMAGMATFALEMDQVKPFISQIFQGIMINPQPGDDFYHDDNPDLMLDALEAWIDERVSVEWGKPVPWLKGIYDRMVEDAYKGHLSAMEAG